MSAFQVYGGLFLLLLLCPTSMCGCSEEQSKSTGEDTAVPADDLLPKPGEGSHNDQGGASAVATSVRFEDVLELWESGKKDDAVRQILSIPWDEPAVFAEQRLLNIPEDQVASLPVEERVRIQQDGIEMATKLQALVEYALSVGDDRLTSGDLEAARAHYEAVRRLGLGLSKPDRSKIAQFLMGRKTLIRAQEKLSTLE